MCIQSFEHLTYALPDFQFYYNSIRPHQYLDGFSVLIVAIMMSALTALNKRKTTGHGRPGWQPPQGSISFYQRPKRIYRFEAWGGLLIGDYLVH